MPLITPADLSTHIYTEIINEITRNDDSIATIAINAAIQEAKLYLSRYNLVQLFGTETIEAVINDTLLKSLVKDIAVWHLLKLSNTNIDQATHRLAYEDAIKTLKNIMSGAAVPDGWPFAEPATNESDGDTISWTSNEKRRNYY